MSQSASVQCLWVDDRLRWSVQSVEAWTKPTITFDTSILIFSIAAVSSSGLIKGGLSCSLALLTEADARFAELLSYKVNHRQKLAGNTSSKSLMDYEAAATTCCGSATFSDRASSSANRCLISSAEPDIPSALLLSSFRSIRTFILSYLRVEKFEAETADSVSGRLSPAAKRCRISSAEPDVGNPCSLNI